MFINIRIFKKLKFLIKSSELENLFKLVTVIELVDILNCFVILSLKSENI